MREKLPTYPQFTQAIVPWPFTVWATSDNSFRWESPDVAASTEHATVRPLTHTHTKEKSFQEERTESNTLQRRSITVTVSAVGKQ